MKKLYIKARKDSPEVILDPETNLFTVKGICHPENVTKFYEPVMHWLEEYRVFLSKKPDNREIRAEFFFRYFNSATYKYLLTLFQKMNEFTELGNTIFIEWHYEEDDEEMRESGEELFEFSGLKIPHKCIESKF
jgi:hypothetical protein